MVTDDDVAVQDSLYTAGRRGVGVTVLLEKIAGAAAEEGRSLAEVADVARRVNGAGRSMGMALTSCTVPAAGQPTFDLPDDEMEIGIGIHGEPGRRRVPLGTGPEIAELLVEPILADLDFTGGDGVLAFVNGMGGTPLIELYVMYNEVAPILEKAGVRGRPLAGRALHHQPGHGRLLGHPAQGRRRAAAALGRAGAHARPAVGHLSADDRLPDDVDARPALRPLDPGVRRRRRRRSRDLLTRLDSAIGDADHGANMDRGMTAVVAALDEDAPGRPRPRCSSRPG